MKEKIIGCATITDRKNYRTFNILIKFDENEEVFRSLPSILGRGIQIFKSINIKGSRVQALPGSDPIL